MKEGIKRLTKICLLVFCFLWASFAFSEAQFKGSYKRTLDNVIERVNAEEKRNDIFLKESESIQKEANQALERLTKGNIEKREVENAHFDYSVALASVMSLQETLDESALEHQDLQHELKRKRLKFQELQLKTETRELKRKQNRLNTTIEFLNLLI